MGTTATHLTKPETYLSFRTNELDIRIGLDSDMNAIHFV